MTAYLIAEIDVHDAATYEDYKLGVPASMAPYGGRYLARGGRATMLEGDRDPARMVILAFPDMDALEAWYGSAEYAPLKVIRETSATSRLIALEGLG